jgi:hypothetical protein
MFAAYAQYTRRWRTCLTSTTSILLHRSLALSLAISHRASLTFSSNSRPSLLLPLRSIQLDIRAPACIQPWTAPSHWFTASVQPLLSLSKQTCSHLPNRRLSRFPRCTFGFTTAYCALTICLICVDLALSHFTPSRSSPLTRQYGRQIVVANSPPLGRTVQALVVMGKYARPRPQHHVDNHRYCSASSWARRPLAQSTSYIPSHGGHWPISRYVQSAADHSHMLMPRSLEGNDRWMCRLKRYDALKASSRN